MEQAKHTRCNSFPSGSKVQGASLPSSRLGHARRAVLWQRGRLVGQRSRPGGPETVRHAQPSAGRGTKAIQCRKQQPFQQMEWEPWTSTGTERSHDQTLTSLQK